MSRFRGKCVGLERRALLCAHLTRHKLKRSQGPTDLSLASFWASLSLAQAEARFRVFKLGAQPGSLEVRLGNSQD